MGALLLLGSALKYEVQLDLNEITYLLASLPAECMTDFILNAVITVKNMVISRRLVGKLHVVHTVLVNTHLRHAI